MAAFSPRRSTRTSPADLPEEPYRCIAKDHLADLYDEFTKSHSVGRTCSFESFCAGEIARVTHGWTNNGNGLELSSNRFHPGFLRCAIDRRVTRERCARMMKDLVRTPLLHAVPPLANYLS